jgi:hypothetical protein
VSDVGAAVIAGIILVAIWLCIAAPAGFLVHRRMRRAEARLGTPALPPHELPLLLMAVAAVAWPVALVVALAAWLMKDGQRLARNVTLIFLLQITASVVGAACLTIWHAANPAASEAEELLSLVVMACATLGTGILAATPFLWIWAGRRADRLRLAPPRGETPGLWRFAVYVASLFFWPLGVVLAVVFTAPENARVGANAFRCSLVQLAGVALAVCLAVPFVVQHFFLP